MNFWFHSISTGNILPSSDFHFIISYYYRRLSSGCWCWWSNIYGLWWENGSFYSDWCIFKLSFVLEHLLNSIYRTRPSPTEIQSPDFWLIAYVTNCSLICTDLLANVLVLNPHNKFGQSLPLPFFLAKMRQCEKVYATIVPVAHSYSFWFGKA